MELQEAQALKALLIDEIKHEESVIPRTGRVISMLADPVLHRSTAAFPDPGGLGLGIALLGPRKYGIAVRIQRDAPETRQRAAEIEDKTRGDADVQFVGRIRARAHLKPGDSIGHSLVTAGTLGTFVTVTHAPGTHILSNNHVLAACDRADLGDEILHPGKADHTPQNPARRIGTLSGRVRYLTHRATVNTVDAATCLVDEGMDIDLPAIQGVVEAETQMGVEKIGRTTHTTDGTVTALDVDALWVETDIGFLRFDGQIEIDGTTGPFSLGGDSGSLVTSHGSEAVGLLFAGSDEGGQNGTGLTYANPIDAVFSQLDAALP